MQVPSKELGLNGGPKREDPYLHGIEGLKVKHANHHITKGIINYNWEIRDIWCSENIRYGLISQGFREEVIFELSSES